MKFTRDYYDSLPVHSIFQMVYENRDYGDPPTTYIAMKLNNGNTAILYLSVSKR